MKKALLSFVAGAALAFTAVLPGTAQAEYPEKPVSFIVPWPPGDLEDVLTRLIADEFQSMYGVPAAVVNKPGGGGGPFPGAVSVANAPADGYTIGSFVSDVPVTGPTIGIPELNPNPFEPLGIFMTYPFVIAAKSDAPYKNWDELAAYGAVKDVSFGHFGSFLPPTQITFAVAQTSGFDFASEAAMDELNCNTLESGDADVINTTLKLIKPCMDKVNVLASIGEVRLPQTPDAPTVQEINPFLTMSLWNGLFVRKEVPDEARQKITKAAMKALKRPEVKKMMEDSGVLVYWKTADQSKRLIEKDIKVSMEVNKMLGE